MNQLPAGSFTITNDFTCPQPGAEVYLTSTGGNPGLTAGTNNAALALMAALGPCSGLSSSTFISINELTTVGSIAALANYMTSYSAIGSATTDATALQTAFSTVAEFTDTTQGTAPGPSLPAGSYASSLEIQTLGDAISACINSPGGVAGDPSPCGMLFTDATPTGGVAPTNTIAAALNIINNPGLNACAIFNLVPASPPFPTTLTACPSSWTLPISTLAVTVSGPSTVAIGQTAQYAAAVAAPGRGATNQSVTWEVNGVLGGNAASGTISATGLYTPPSTGPGGPVTISAVSALAATATGSLTVTVAPEIVTVSGSTNVLFGAQATYTATNTNASSQTSQSVNWMVNGTVGGSSAQGTITAGGVYTAPATTPPTPVVIGAQSTDAPSVIGSANVTISATAITAATGDTRIVTQPIYPGSARSCRRNSTPRSAPRRPPQRPTTPAASRPP